MMKRMQLAALVAVGTLAGAACSTLGKQAFADPVVTLKDVKIVSAGMTGGNLDVVLNVYNPNGYRLDATRMTYRVFVDSTPLANGILDNTFTVQNKDSTQVRIPVSFTFSGLGAAGRSIMNTGAVNYRVTGDVTVGSVVGNFTIPFSQTGRYSALGR
ncbi:MAG TPA: LEA type 2 family protein [Gemmatimonadaceae bacterium]|jgi:LEA14-like dessication related protein